MIIHYSEKCRKKLKKLEKSIALRILDKMDWFFKQDEPLFFAKELKNLQPLTHRFRVGYFRVVGICLEPDNTFLVVDIDTRDSIYKK